MWSEKIKSIIAFVRGTTKKLNEMHFLILLNGVSLFLQQ